MKNQIEQVAQKFIETSEELTRLTGAIAYGLYPNGPGFHLSKDSFNNVTSGLQVATKALSGNDFWVEKWVNIGGIKFFYLEQDGDEWARALGYVKAEEAKTAKCEDEEVCEDKIELEDENE